MFPSWGLLLQPPLCSVGGPAKGDKWGPDRICVLEVVRLFFSHLFFLLHLRNSLNLHLRIEKKKYNHLIYYSKTYPMFNEEEAQNVSILLSGLVGSVNYLCVGMSKKTLIMLEKSIYLWSTFQPCLLLSSPVFSYCWEATGRYSICRRSSGCQAVMFQGVC